MKINILEDGAQVLDVDSFMEGSEPCSLSEDLRKERAEEQNNRLGPQPYILEMGQTWSILSRRIVGYGI